MAGNKAVFQDAVRKAHNYAWDRNWTQAVAEYRRALNEKDNDAVVWMSLGAALTEMKRWADARFAYERARDLRPDDLSLQQKLAEIYERSGNIESALQTYLQLATTLEKLREPAKAVGPWREILRLQPLHLDSHQHVADLLEQLNRLPEASRENAVLAGLLRERGRVEEAEARARKALLLDPSNAEARAFVAAMQAPVKPSGGVEALSPDVAREPANPVQRAKRVALKRLTDYVLENGQRGQPGQEETLAQLSRAIEHQAQHRIADAIEGYQHALALGADSVEIRFILGVLHLDTLDTDAAIAEFGQSLDSAAYALASQYALGCCYGSLGDYKSATGHLLEAVHSVESGLIARNRAAVMNQTWRELARRLESISETESAQLSKAIVDFFSAKRWPELAANLRRRLDAASADGTYLPLVEIIATRHANEILDAIGTCQEFLAREHYAAAVEECLRAIAIAPTYLPLHTQLADIFARQGRTDAAVDKYKAMAAIARARGDVPQVIECYRRIVKFAPQDQEVRAGLIDLLVERGEIGESIDLYIAAGQSYFEMAQLDRALNAYQSALRLIPRAGGDHWTASILHLIGEIYMRRASWNEALAIYTQIRQMAPDDEKARLRLVDLNYRLERDADTESELADLIRICREAGDTGRLVHMVKDMADHRPRNLTLRNTLVDLLVETGQRQQAIAELDALGDLQMSTGQTHDAIHTIERIIELAPDNAGEYRTLLDQLQRSP